MKRGGWVKVYRSLKDHPIWTGERFTRGQAWVDLLMHANYADQEVIQGNKVILVKRGQVFTKQTDLAKRWRWRRETVGTFLRFLETRTMVGIETSKHTDSGYTRITIQNYERYQGGEEEPEPIPSAIPSSMQSRNPSSIHPASDCGAGAQGSVIAAAIAQARERTGNPDGCESACPTAPASTATSTQHPPAIPSATIKEVKKGKTSMADADGASAGTAGGSKGQPRKPRTTHPDTEALLVEFQERYKARCRDDYFPSHGRDRKLLSELLRRKGPEEARTRMHLFFENGTKRTRDLGDYSVPAFHSAWHQIGVLLARGDL